MPQPSRWPTMLLLCAALVLSACGGAAPAAPASEQPAAPAAGTEAPAAPAANTDAPAALSRDPKTLVVAALESADNLDPAQAYNAANNLITRAVYEGLLRLKGSSATEVEPVLAESFEVSADQSTWTFKIRQGVTFHDGTPLNAQAVYDSMARTIDLKAPTWYILGRFIGEDPAATIKVVDEYTLEFALGAPQPLFGVGLAAAYGTGIISPKAFNDNNKDGDLGKEWLLSNAVGTGPFKLEKFAPNEEFVLARNADYWRGWEGEGKFERVIIRPIPESSTRRQLLEQGDADIALNPSADDLEALAATGQFSIGDEPLLRVDYIAYNTSGPLKDPRVRQAIGYAFDYEGYMQGVRKGVGAVAQGPFPRNLVGHDKAAFQYATDLEKARALLQEAGWVDGTEVTYTYYPGFNGENVGPVLQAQLEQIGIALKIEERDIASFNGLFYGDQPPEERPDMFWYAWWPDYNDFYNYAWVLFHSDAGGSAGANAGFYSNPRVDELLDQLASVVDPAERDALAKEVQQILTLDDPAGLWVEDAKDHTVFRNDIEGQVYNPLYTNTFDFWALARRS
jgi:peptide/nickel transport system substrate-binding protein